MDKDEYFRQIQQHFGTGAPPVSMGWIVMLAGVLMLVIGGLSLRHWWRTRKERPTPMLSFLSLAGELGLTASEQWLLARLAAARKLPTPITLLLSPRTLSHHARAWTEGMSRRRSDKLMRRVDAVGRKLFGVEGVHP